MNDPAKPPLPTPSYLPFHAAAGGSHTSNVISESGDGLIVPCTRQKGAFTATGVGGSLPTTLDGGVTLVAAVVVASPKVLPARLPQSAATAPPALKNAHAATAPAVARRKRLVGSPFNLNMGAPVERVARPRRTTLGR